MNTALLLGALLLAQVGEEDPYLSLPETPTSALLLKDVLQSVQAHYPLLRAVELKQTEAEGKLLSARGAFDLKLKGKGSYDPLGFYDQQNAEFGAEQPTGLWGAEFFGKYRYGNDHPIYNAKSVTGDRGELQLGVVVPLWRNGPIDERRLGVRLAELGVDMAELVVRKKRLEIADSAVAAYWKWVVSGRKLVIKRALLEIAQARVGGLSAQVERGQRPRLALLDNERLILNRRQEVVAAERVFVGAAFKLSLYLRDERGDPLRASKSMLPSNFPALSVPVPTELQDGLQRSLSQRPELALLERRVEQLRAERGFQRNQQAPAIDLGLAYSKDFGEDQSYGPDTAFKSKSPSELLLTLGLSWAPWQRKARGKVVAIDSKLRMIELERRYVQEAIHAEIRDTWAAFQAAYERASLSKRAYQATLTIEKAERRRLELGESDLLIVNLREASTAKAAQILITAMAEYHRARAHFMIATGQEIMPGAL